MASMADLPSSVIGRIIAYAVEPLLTTLGSRMCAFELVSTSWRSAIHAPDSIEAWRLICKLEFPGSTAATRTDYHNLRHPATQSAARVIQRAISRRFCERSRFLLSAACIVCGVRWGYGYDLCELWTCPFIPSRYRYPRNFESSELFVCKPCGERYPDKAMGDYCYHESLQVCFKCKGTCDGGCFDSSTTKFLNWIIKVTSMK